MTESPAAERFAWLALGFGVIAAWWLPILTPPILTFYKEWLVVVALGFAGLGIGHRVRCSVRPVPVRHPLILAAAAIVAVLLAQSLTMDGVWRKAIMSAAGAGFFIYTILLGRGMLQRRGDQSLP